MFLVSCGNRLEAYKELQEITSPGYPFKHLDNEICSWPIVAPQNYVIEIYANQISKETCCDRVQVKLWLKIGSAICKNNFRFFFFRLQKVKNICCQVKRTYPPQTTSTLNSLQTTAQQKTLFHFLIEQVQHFYFGHSVSVCYVSSPIYIISINCKKLNRLLILVFGFYPCN